MISAQPTSSLLARLQQIVTILAFLGTVVALYGSYRSQETLRDAAVAAVKNDVAAIHSDVATVRADVKELRVEILSLQVAIARLEAKR